MAKTATSNRVLTDHDEIMEWVEERGGRPAHVRGTGDQEEDAGLLRIEFPGFGSEDRLEPVDWDEWLEKFDENHLALIVQDETSGGERSNFNKLVNRENVEEHSGKQKGRGNASGGRSSAKKVAGRSKQVKGRSSRSGKKAA